METYLNKQVSINDLVPVFKELLDSGRNINFTPKGTSMLPMLGDNVDTVTLSKPTEKLKKYDVVFFEYKPTNSYVLHRIIRLNEDGTYDVSGDNMLTCEKSVSRSDIFAVVTSFTHNNKTHKTTDLSYKFYSMKTVFKKKMKWKYNSLKSKLYPYYRKIKRK